MVEFHINDFEQFIYLIKGAHYGGLLSVRFTEGQRPVMNTVQDECTFNQYIFSPRLWTVPDGETLLIPKMKAQG